MSPSERVADFHVLDHSINLYGPEESLKSLCHVRTSTLDTTYIYMYIGDGLLCGGSACA